MLESAHHQVVINGVDFDLIMRPNDEETEYTSWDLFDYDQQTYIHTSHDMELAAFILTIPVSFDKGDR
jgi:hypothetical protein